jgi:hypothetical protein
MAVKSQGDDNTKLRQDMCNLRQEVHGARLADSSQVKKLKTDSQYTWKYEGNKVQYLLNFEFLEDLAQTVWAIDNLKFEHAREKISDLVEKVKRRNKLIKIADTREGGWEAVRQYESNPVVSDSDDESKINKADNKALRIRNFKGKKIPAKSIQSNRLSLPHRILLAKTSPFVNPRHDIPVYQSIKTNPAQTDISVDVNKEADVLVVGRSSTGGINVPSIQNPSSKHQKQTDMIKDEYFNINDCNNLGEISNLTHNYYEYEQGQADIIVQSS